MRNLWIVAAVWLFSGAAGAFQTINNGTTFPAVVQGHGGTSNGWCGWWGNNYSTLTMNGSAKITGTEGRTLNFCYSNQNAGMPVDSCDNSNGSRRLCTITPDTIQGLSTSGGNAFLAGNGSSGGVPFCSAGQAISLGSASQYQFSSLSLYSSCTVTFSSARTEYRIQKIEAGSGAKLILPSGDYWIDQLTLNQGAEIEIQGEVRIFVKQATQLNGAVLNRSGTGSLLLFGYQDITLNNDTLLNGYVYSDQTLVLNNTSVINGRTTSRSLTMASNSAINDQAFAPSLTCFNDDFSRTGLGDNWVVSQRNNSELPSIQSGRLRMTRNIGNQATSATYQRLFPAASNLVEVTFRYYAWSPQTGTGGDGLAVILSDATVTPQPGSFGGALGYAQRDNGTPGFAGGWLGVGLDEYGNFSNPNEGKVGGPGARAQAIAIRGGVGSSYRYLAGTTANISPRVDVRGTSSAQPGHLYRLRIDSRVAGRSMVSLDRNTGSGFSTLVAPFDAMATAGQEQVPADFLLSLTGSTGGANNNHELDDIQICALRSNPIGVQIDHFQLDHSGQPLTCNPETVTVKACADAACNTLITDPVTATLSLTPTSASNGWIGGNTVTFSGGSTTVQLRNNTPTAVTIGVSGSTPTTKPFSTTLCKAGAGTPSAAACTLNFADSGFFFDVPDTYSNQPQTVTIKAVKKSDVTKLCVPGFASQTKSVKFWSSYITPTSNPYNSQMSVNSSTIGASQGAATPLSLVFDAQGQSTITVKYPDAGKVQLDARYDGTGSEAGLVMLGADQFVARPVGLCITPPQGGCAAGDSSCPVFKKAGEAFQVDIKAMAWESANDGDICVGNQTTPNFALPNIALGSTLVAPNPGINATLGTTAYNHVAAANSANSVSQTVSEVGVFRMTATPPANGYFNYTIPSAQSQPVGRFIPADFNLVSGDIVPACNAFSYMGQPFGVMLDVLARNTTGVQTRNYTGPFAKGEAYLSVANDKDGKSLSSRLRSLQPLPWLNGRAALTTGSSEFVRLSGTQPDGPYKSLLFGLYMRDNDGDRTLIASPNFNDAVVGNCSGSGCNARQIDSVPMKAYFGRLQAGTAAGLASAPLAIPLQMQYYEAGNWLQNKEDQCTQLSLANQGFIFLNPSHTFDAATRELNLGAGRKIKLGLGSSAPGGDAALAKDGEILFHFAKPDISVRIPYKVDLAKQPSSPLWLSDPTSANDGNLQGEAIFGSSRGNDRIIYRREVLH
ncbi:TPA: MSHA biogenesis protein MshQ [Aeromonas veronii]|nr:MSHA biogenesis protein MshQ [Aeromonas veronii]